MKKDKVYIIFYEHEYFGDEVIKIYDDYKDALKYLNSLAFKANYKIEDFDVCRKYMKEEKEK